MRNNSIAMTAQLALLIVALLYLATKALLDTSDTTDFKSIWLAGRFWLGGLNPYSLEYAQAGESLFVGLNRPNGWFYPPNWWPIAVAISFLDYDLAGRVWRILNGCLVILGCAVLISCFRDYQRNSLRWIAVVIVVYVSTMSATAISLSLGQTSILIFFGLCLFTRAWLFEDWRLMIVALALLALKPPIGLVLAGLLMPAKFWWRSLLGAGVVVCLFSTPPLLLHGWDGVISLMLLRIEDYGSFDVNAPPSTTGLRSILFHIFGASVSPVHLTLLALISSSCLGILSLRFQLERDRLLSLSATIAAGVAIVPMHTYDAVLLAPLVLAVPVLSFGIGFFVFLSLLVVWRNNNLSELFDLVAQGETYFSGTLVLSVVALILTLFLAALVTVRAVRGIEQERPATG